MKIRIFTLILLLLAALAAGIPASAQEGAAPASGISAPIKAVLQVPLPFVPEDPNLSDYISGVYRLAIGMAALFAVVMMIIAGYQWIFSGGGSDKISSAKKRIFGAAIGLMLALLSYVMLNAITPRLVALRLPDVEPVGRSVFDLNETCQSNKTFAEYEARNNMAEGRLFAWPVHLSFEEALRQDMVVTRENAACGQNYFIENIDRSQPVVQSLGQCPGEACFDAQGNKLTRVACFRGQCVAAYLYGDLIAEQAFSPTPHRRSVKRIAVRTVCASGIALTADEREISDNASKYAFLLNEPQFKPGIIGSILGLALCTIGDPKGYVLEIEVNTGLLGGINNHYLVGKDCTQSVVEFRNDLPSFDDVSPSQLFQKEDFENAQRCDLDTNNFPGY